MNCVSGIEWWSLPSPDLDDGFERVLVLPFEDSIVVLGGMLEKLL